MWLNIQSSWMFLFYLKKTVWQRWFWMRCMSQLHKDSFFTSFLSTTTELSTYTAQCNKFTPALREPSDVFLDNKGKSVTETDWEKVVLQTKLIANKVWVNPGIRLIKQWSFGSHSHQGWVGLGKVKLWVTAGCGAKVGSWADHGLRPKWSLLQSTVCIPVFLSWHFSIMY